jgi:hypothetical protein
MMDKITLCKNLNNTRVKPHSSKYEEKKTKQNKTKTGKLAEI